ncbi:MAG: YitT family protein [Clostridia bacterium]|nr:YitT family protein [Clostridia bacterium]
MNRYINDKVMDWLADIAGAFLLGTGIFCFAEKMNIAPGGVSGVAIMIKYLTGLPVGIVSFFINMPLLFLAYRFIGKKFALRTIRTVIINTVILDSIILPLFPQYAGDRMVGSVFGGVCMGAGIGIIFMRGSSTGGTDILSYFIEKKFPYIQLGKAIMAIDCVVLATSMLVFGNIESALYGIVALFCQMQLIDRIVYGTQKGRQMLVISKMSEQIAQRILEQKKRGVTFLYGNGAYSGKDIKVLMCVIRIWEYHDIKEIVYSIDPDAFVIASEAEQIIGEGFSSV